MAPSWARNECGKVWQRTEPVWLIRRLSVSAGLTDTSKPGKHKELLTFPKKKHNLHPSCIFTNFTPHSALTIWAEWSHTQWGRKALKKVFICVLLATQTDGRDHLSFDSLKEKRKAGGGGGGGGKSTKSALPDVFFSFFMRFSLCRQSLYLPFISASLILLVGRVSGRQSLSPSLWCFCRLQRAFEAAALLIAKASDRPMPSVRLTAK